MFASGGEAERLAERDAALRFAGPPRRDASGTRRRIRRRSHALRIARRTAGAATRRTGPDARTRRNRRELIRVTHAASFAPASGAEPGRLRRFAQDFAPKPYLCTASGRKDAETGQAAGRAPLARKKPHVDKSRQADGIAIPPQKHALPLFFKGETPFRPKKIVKLQERHSPNGGCRSRPDAQVRSAIQSRAYSTAASFFEQRSVQWKMSPSISPAFHSRSASASWVFIQSSRCGAFAWKSHM